MSPRSSHTLQRFMHAHLHAQTTGDVGDIRSWRITDVLITEATRISPIGATCQEENGRDSWISSPNLRARQVIQLTICAHSWFKLGHPDIQICAQQFLVYLSILSWVSAIQSTNISFSSINLEYTKFWVNYTYAVKYANTYLYTINRSQTSMKIKTPCMTHAKLKQVHKHSGLIQCFRENAV